MSTPSRRYRVESFSGDVKPIEVQLNEIAAEGWSLVTAAHNARTGYITWVFERSNERPQPE